MKIEIEQSEEGKNISFTLNKDRQLVVDLCFPSGKERIVLTTDNTDMLRLMLYDAYRARTWKMTRKEKSARNKALWALAKVEGKRKPDKVTIRRYEAMVEHTKEDEDPAEGFIFPETDDTDFIKGLDDTVQKGIDEMFRHNRIK